MEIGGIRKRNSPPNTDPSIPIFEQEKNKATLREILRLDYNTSHEHEE